LEAPDKKSPVTSITADASFIYLGLNQSSIIKLNVSDGQKVKLVRVSEDASGYFGLKLHPYTGDLYIIQYIVSDKSTTTTIGSWYVVQLDSNLNILSKKEAAYLGNETNLLAPFAFDYAGLMYQLVSSNQTIFVIDPQTGIVRNELSLSNIELNLANATSSNWIWVDQSNAVYITVPGLDLAYK
jgi:glutamine cyclotransferase